MSDQTISYQVNESAEPKASRRIRSVLSDALAFVRSVESNKALMVVTLGELMGDQIKRNGESASSNSSQYNPYSLDPDKEKAASEEPSGPVNFLGVSDTGRPTKVDLIMALKNEIGAVVDQVKNTEVQDIASYEEYEDAMEDAAPGEL